MVRKYEVQPWEQYETICPYRIDLPVVTQPN